MLEDTQLPTQPDTMICFALYTASHAINRAYVPLLKDLGLTYPQWITLMFLWENDDQSVGSLSTKLQMQTNTLTPLLKRLEALGHVTRTRNPKDERKVFISLTSSGRALQKHSNAVTRCVIESTGFDLPMLENLVKVLSTLRDQVATAD